MAPDATIDRSLNQVSKLDVDPRQGAPQVGQHPLLAPLAGVGVGRHLRRPVGDVVALVAVLGDGPAGPGGGQRLGEQLDLPAPVVDVVLPVDLVAAPVEDPAQGVAVGRPPSAAGVEGAGGVGADELDVDPLAAAQIGPGVALDAGLHHLAEDGVQPAVVEAEVHEAGAGDGDLGHVGRRVRR